MTMKSKLITLVLLSSAAVFGQVSLGIRIGPPPAPRVVAVPPTPGPGYVRVGGYWYPAGGHYRWHEGIGPVLRMKGQSGSPRITTGSASLNGCWQRPNGERFEHNHDWGRDRDWRH